jgi:flavin-dependent dehydrogenase
MRASPASKFGDGVAVEKVVFDGQLGRQESWPSQWLGENTISAKVVVDASGRSTVIGQQLGFKGDVPGLKKASLWGYYRGGKRLAGA